MSSIFAAAFGSLREELALGAVAAGFAVWLRATRHLRRGDRGDRAGDAFLAAAWLAVVAFYLLAWCGAFRLLPALAVLLLAAGGAVAHRSWTASASPAPQQPPTAPATARGERSARFLLAAVAVPVAAVAALHLLKGLVAPPLAWDALTYHLPKAAIWVQTGRLSLPRFPDAWSYYAWFPGGADALSAWLLLPAHRDALIAPCGFVVWALTLLAARRLAGTFGAAPLTAWLAGVAIAALPCVLAFMTSAYADGPELLFQLLAAAHALAYHRESKSGDALHAAAAAGLASAVKATGIALALPTCALLAFGLLRHRGRRRALIAVGMATALLLPAVGYLHTWRATGSPFYPSPAPGPLAALFPYHHGLTAILSGAGLPPERVRSYGLGTIVRLFSSGSGPREHLDFGPGGFPLVSLALVGLGFGVARRRSRPAALYALACALLVMPLFCGPGTLALRTVWIRVFGRLLAPALAPALLAAAFLPRRIALAAFAGAVLGSLFQALPLGWSPAMTRPAGVLVVLLSATAGATVVADRALRRAGRARRRLLVVAVACLLVYPSWTRLRDDAREPIWAETTENAGAFDAHPLHGAFSPLVPIAAFLDRPEGVKVAVAPGFDGVGQDQFLYPLFGSRLQNRLAYVPVTAAGDDDALDLGARTAAADPARWLERMAVLRPDFVVGLWPNALERGWAAARPDRFEMVPPGPDGVHWLARFRAAPP